MRSADALGAFCAELADDKPSPGGGSAAAGAGAIAASLLAMVCGVTAKSKKHADRAETMLRMRDELMALQARLLENARLDAEAYDAVVAASRRRRELPGVEAETAFESSLRHAAEVPMRTAEACSAVLEIGIRVAELGSKSAWSDIGAALLLAEAGFNGAAMNVRINLDMIHDDEYVRTAGDRIQALAEVSSKRFLDATGRLQTGRNG